MGNFAFPNDAIALVDALKADLGKHVHDDFTDETTFALERFLQLLDDRDRAVESAFRRLPPELPWMATGTLVAGGSTGPFTPKQTLTVVEFSVTLKVSAATTTASTAKLYRGTTAVATVTLPAGSTYGFVPVLPPVNFQQRVDVMTVQWPTLDANVTAIGGGIGVV